MKKKLLLAAISAAVSMPVWADVKVGGMAQVEVAQEKIEATSATGTTASLDGQTVEDNSRGRFWIAADEDLGSGMKGLALYEFRVDTTGACELEGAGVNTSACSSDQNIREKYVGLQTGFGTLKLGSVRNPYKYAGGVLWDAFVTTNLEARGNGGMSGGVFGHNNFMDNGINYVSPTFFGVTISGTYVPDDVTSSTSQTTNSGDAGASVEWKGFGFHVPVAYSRDNRANNDLEAIKAGVRYDIGPFGAMVQAEMLESEDGGTDDLVAFLGLQGKFGPVTAVVQAGMTEEDGGATNADIAYVALGAWYNFSKTFGALVGYRNSQCERNGTAATSTCGNATVVESESDVITLGLRKTF